MVIEIPYFIRTDPNCGEKKEQICRDAVEKSDPARAEMKRKTTRAKIETNTAVWEMCYYIQYALILSDSVYIHSGMI